MYFLHFIIIMNLKSTSIRPFIGAKDFNVSRSFYKDIGFQESIIDNGLIYIKINDTLGFYLQDAFVEDWMNNSMIFIEVENVNDFYTAFLKLDLERKYNTVRLLPIVKKSWGAEFFLHDPSGILLHFGCFV